VGSRGTNHSATRFVIVRDLLIIIYKAGALDVDSGDIGGKPFMKILVLAGSLFLASLSFCR